VFDDEISNRTKEIFVYIALNYKIMLVEWNHHKDHATYFSRRAQSLKYASVGITSKHKTANKTANKKQI